MATHPVPDCYYAGMVTPVFDLEQTLSTSWRFIRRGSAIWALNMLKMGWIISPYTVKQAAFNLQQKETGSKTVAIAKSKYTSCGAFLSVQHACQIPIILHNYSRRYSLFCVLTSIMSHLMTSSVRNLHNTKILNISGTSWDMTKRKTEFFFTFKVFHIRQFFNTSSFHFIGTLRQSKLIATIMILKNTLEVYLRSSAKFEKMSSAFWRALTFLFTIVQASVLRK